MATLKGRAGGGDDLLYAQQSAPLAAEDQVAGSIAFTDGPQVVQVGAVAYTVPAGVEVTIPTTIATALGDLFTETV